MALRASGVRSMDGEAPVVRVDGKLRAAGEPGTDVLRLLGPTLAGESVSCAPYEAISLALTAAEPG